MRFLAVLDGTTGTAVRQARALGAFLRDGAQGDLTGETVVLYHDEGDRDGLVELAPTPEVRLVRVPARRPDRVVDVLVAAARTGDAALFLFAWGGGSAELATRLACRVGGAVVSDALDVEAGPDRLVCRKNVYSAHMVGRFELRSRPWCVGLDASWNDASPAAPSDHRIVSETDDSGEAGEAPFEDVELLAAPTTSDLADSRFLVVAGNGAGSRSGVERIEKAARRMGAAFGVTRPVAMSALAPMDRLIGVSGVRAAPVLCIVAGAYGAPAFFWGIEKAAFIVAINVDDGAPIVGNADTAVIDDGVAVIEELADIISAQRTGD